MVGTCWTHTCTNLLRQTVLWMTDEIQAISLKTLYRELFRQLDTVRVLPFPLVFLGKNLFEPLRLSLRRFLIHESGFMKNDELLAANVTPKCAHFLESWCPLSRLTLLDRHCSH